MYNFTCLNMCVPRCIHTYVCPQSKCVYIHTYISMSRVRRINASEIW
uniref:Uncharacterized protein n=1 Tax=Anguilla anguilla TaxID=7936 RepID=A0A0E9WGS1_ANGAN